jgi:hypothetical protein
LTRLNGFVSCEQWMHGCDFLMSCAVSLPVKI